MNRRLVEQTIKFDDLSLPHFVWMLSLVAGLRLVLVLHMFFSPLVTPLRFILSPLDGLSDTNNDDEDNDNNNNGMLWYEGSICWQACTQTSWIQHRWRYAMEA